LSRGNAHRSRPHCACYPARADHCCLSPQDRPARCREKFPDCSCSHSR